MCALLAAEVFIGNATQVCSGEKCIPLLYHVRIGCVVQWRRIWLRVYGVWEVKHLDE